MRFNFGPRPSLKEFLVKCSSEVLSTALLMFFGCMGCVTGTHSTHLNVCLVFALVVMICVQIFGHISGCHMNPAVTISAVMSRLISPFLAIFYIPCQFLGSILGFGLLKFVVPKSMILSTHRTRSIWLTREDELTLAFCVTLPHDGVSDIQALFVEIMTTGALILACCSVWDIRNADKQESVPLKFGLIVAPLILVAGPFSGASLNTARTFGPALWCSVWRSQWIYWVGPNASAVLFTLIYRILFRPKSAPAETLAATAHTRDEDKDV